MINLSLEIAEIETVLKHIGQGAYKEVAELIAKIHSQAVPQVQSMQAAQQPVVLGTPESVAPKQQSDDQPVA